MLDPSFQAQKVNPITRPQALAGKHQLVVNVGFFRAAVLTQTVLAKQIPLWHNLRGQIKEALILVGFWNFLDCHIGPFALGALDHFILDPPEFYHVTWGQGVTPLIFTVVGL